MFYIRQKTHVPTAYTKIAAEKALEYLDPFKIRKSKLNRFNKITLYKIVVQSILLYACPVWGSGIQIHIQTLTGPK